MNVRLLLFLLLISVSPAWAQGFAGLGQTADGFAVPTRGQGFDFPADHGPHPAYRIEWWYVTATLQGADGRAYGVQWTLFRSARAPAETGAWDSPQSWMGHAALTTPTAHYAAERFGRGGTGQAGVQADPFAAWIDDWEMAGQSDLSDLTVNAQGVDFAYDLRLTTNAPLIFHGDQGYSVKSPAGQASYYYSQPFYQVTGAIETPAGAVKVTGQAWLDREYSSQPLADTQSGWDWFSLSLEDGHKLMGFVVRDSAGQSFTSATWITPDGATEALPDGAFQAVPLGKSDVAGRKVPTTWQVTIPTKGLDLTVKALNPAAWNDLTLAYWEGPVEISGSHEGTGYLEMTGYE